MILAGCLCILLLTVLPLWAYAGIRRWKQPDCEPTVTVSILIPFRNETGRIRPLLDSLDAISASPGQVIFINDHSDDGGDVLVAEWVKGRENAQLLHNPPGLNGKKAALQKGIGAAGGEVILTTDADCRLPEHWIRHMTAGFNDPSVQLVAGLVKPRKGEGILYGFTSLEMAALTGISAGSLGHGVPTMCNGANLAFRRSAFYAVGGYASHDHIPSGDDEFLLTELAAHYPEGVRYCCKAGAVVETDTSASFSGWMQQRIRWSTKWRAKKAGNSAWLGPVLGMGYLGMLGAGIFSLLTGSGLPWITGLFLCKCLADYLLIAGIMRTWGRFPHPVFFLVSELIYPVYVVIFALLSFSRQYEWKGRRYKEAVT